jgi:hypothetical protein
MDEIGVALWEEDHPTRKRTDFRLVFHHENTWPTSSGDKADDSHHHRAGGTECWCSLPRPHSMARHQLAAYLPDRAPAPGPYREGHTGRPVGEGPRLTTPADPLVQRQGVGGATSDGEPRETDPGRGRGHLEDAGTESFGDGHAPATGLPATTAAPRVYCQEQRETQGAGDSDVPCILHLLAGDLGIPGRGRADELPYPVYHRSVTATRIETIVGGRVCAMRR